MTSGGFAVVVLGSNCQTFCADPWPTWVKT